MAQPCESFPTLFARGTLFDRFPFLLPNLVCAVIIVFGVLVGALFFEETHEKMKDRRDYGLEAGKWLVSHLKGRIKNETIVGKAGEAYSREQFALLGDEEPPGYRTTEGSPCQPATPSRSPNALPADAKFKGARGLKRQPRGLRTAFTKQVILNIASIGFLA